MPKEAKELKHEAIKRMKHPTGLGNPRRIAVGGEGAGGLHLQITANDKKSWVLRYTIAGKRRELGLGSYPELGLAEARQLAREARAKVRQGVDPIDERRASREALVRDHRRAFTFAQAVDGYMAICNIKTVRNRKALRSRLLTYTEMFSDRRVGDINKHDIKAVLEPIWIKKSNTAKRVREEMKRVFDWAIGNDHMEGPNPAEWAGNLEYLLPASVRSVERRPAIQKRDAARWMAALRKHPGNACRALEFLVLTASRSNEARGARWNDIDFERGIWTIPAARMKMKQEHRVPLPTAALALLKQQPRDGELIFPAAQGGEMRDLPIREAMQRLHDEDEQGFVDGQTGKPAVPHGWRSAFRSWAADAGYPRDLAEVALAHQVGTAVEQAYQRSDMLERRRAMMEVWAAHLNGKTTDKVVALNG